MEFYYGYIIIVTVIILSLLARRIQVKNKCDVIMTNAEVVALDRQFVNNMDVIPMLDIFVEDCMINVISKNIDYAKLQSVSRDNQIEILNLVSNTVSERISPSLINRLSTVYNKNCMTDVLAERCYLKVLEWAREINGQKYKSDDEAKEFNFSFEADEDR